MSLFFNGSNKYFKNYTTYEKLWYKHVKGKTLSTNGYFVFELYQNNILRFCRIKISVLPIIIKKKPFYF